MTADGQRAVSGSHDKTVRVWDLESGSCSAVLRGHEKGITGVAVTADGRCAVSGSVDKTVRVWDLESGSCSAVLEGHESGITGVAVTADGRCAVSGSDDKTVRVWDLESGSCSAVLEGHSAAINSMAVAADGRRAISGSDDKTVRVWDLESGSCSAVLEGHSAAVLGVAVTADGRLAVSGSHDKTVRVWDLESGSCSAVLEGHYLSIWGVAVTADGRRAVSASDDQTVRVWDLESGSCSAVLRGHRMSIFGVAVTADGRRAVSGSQDTTVRVWDLPPIEITGSPAEGQLVYTNAKVLLAGESGAGKTGLAKRLIHNRFESTYSTDGVWATQLKLPEHGPIPDGVEREIWLWDFAGQADYRLIHQLFMDGTDLALLVFDPQRDNPFEGLAQWDNDITRAAAGRPFVKRLVAGRCDRGGLRVSQGQVEEFQGRHGFAGYHETSARTGDGCDDLGKAIAESIPWDRLPKTSSPTIFKRIKEEILKLKDAGRVLLRRAELKQVLEMRMIGESFTPEILQTVVGLLANAGVVWPLDFGGYVLLQPERINAYAGALVRAVRANIDEIGCITEADVLAGNFPVPDEIKLKEADDEQVVLQAMVVTLLKRGLCLKQPVEGGSMLVFPAYFRRDRPELTEHPPAYVRYRFTGSLDEVYTTLVVRLHHTELLDKDQLWRDAADFKTKVTKLRAGLKLERLPESSGVLTVYLDPKIPIEVKATFMKFVHDHLTDERARRASNVERERLYVCDKCHNPLDPGAARRAMGAGKKDILCVDCEDHRVLLLDEIEKLFQAPETAERAREWKRESQAVLDSQSLEQILLGHVQAIANEAGQIWRPTNVADWGIDGEFEFKDHEGRASGQRVYLHLKSGNSYLEARKKDGVEIFRIKEDRHADYWQKQAYPVWLVIRTTDERSGSSIRWMEISEYLKQKSQGRKTPVKQIEFQGEPLTAQTLKALRDRMVPIPKG
jgi:small GTP-binding protein